MELCSLTQHLAADGAAGAPGRKREKITDKAFGHSKTHEGAQAASELIVLGGGAAKA